METTQAPQTTDVREYRRLRAWELFCQGYPQKEIAQILDVTEGAISQWVHRAKEHGPEALRKRTAPGAPRKLSWQQRAQLPRLLARGATSFGFAEDVWTCARVAQVIQTTFGVSYHPDYVGALLRSCGWSYQKPVCRASQREEAALQEWR